MADNNSNNSDGTGLAGGAGAPGATGAPVQTNNPAALTTEALNEHALDAHPLDAIQSESGEAIPGAPAARTANAAEGGADARPAILDAASSGSADVAGSGGNSTGSSNGSNGAAATGAAATGAAGIITPQPELNEALSPAAGANGQAPRKEVPGGRAYEIIFIGQPGDADASEAATARLRAMIEGGGGAIDNVRTSETRRLAYPIASQIEGVYVVVNTRFEASHIPELDRFFKLEEAVLRHMILKEEV